MVYPSFRGSAAPVPEVFPTCSWEFLELCIVGELAYVSVPVILVLGALGAAFAAGLAVGVWKDVEALKALNAAETTFRAQVSEAECEAKLARWRDAVQRTLGLATLTA